MKMINFYNFIQLFYIQSQWIIITVASLNFH